MDNKLLIPEGFKDHVDWNTNVEHDYKNKIINIFLSNGFDLVKAPLLEFYQNISNNVFIIESKKKEPKLFLRDDITPQIIRIVSSRYKNKIRPIKLCYYGEVTRKKGSMLRPERQFLQVGSEIIGSDSILADIEIISLAYKSLKEIGIKNITLEITQSSSLSNEYSFLKKIHESATKHFQRNLFSDIGQGPMGYLQKRNLSKDVIKKFRIGFALDSWKSLLNKISSDYIGDEQKIETPEDSAGSSNSQNSYKTSSNNDFEKLQNERQREFQGINRR